MDYLDSIVSLSDRIEPKWTSDRELKYLAELAQTSKHFIEIGSWYGRSAKVISHSLPENGILYCVDIFWEGSEKIFRENMKEEISSGKVKVFVGSSDEASPRVREALKGELVDVIWIDDGHLYKDVERDINYYRDFLKPGGLLIGHDYYIDTDVARAVQNILPGFNIVEGTTIWRWKDTR